MFIKYNHQYFEDVYNIVHKTIDIVYPKYYPIEVVDYFHQYHCKKTLENELPLEHTVLMHFNNKVIGTGSLVGHEIKRLFILPEYQGVGYGRKLLKQLEHKALLTNKSSLLLYASLPGFNFYIKNDYNMIEYNKMNLKNDSYLCYFILNKILSNANHYNDIHNTISVNYNNRKFVSLNNSSNGEVAAKTIFYYKQKDSLIWANYEGGHVKKGFLLGNITPNGYLNFSYQHINNMNQIRTGNCISKPNRLPDGTIELYEEWQWTNGDLSKGTSILKEIE